MNESLTVADLVSLEFYTLKMATELESMAERAKLTDKMIISSKARYFKNKNLILQKRIHAILEDINNE